MIKYLLFSALALASTRYIDGDVIRSSDRSSTWTPPGVTDTLLGQSAAQTITNKTIDANQNTLKNLNITPGALVLPGNNSVVFTDSHGQLTPGYFTGGASLSGSVVTLGNPGASQKGGVFSNACLAHQFFNSVNTDASSSCAQPAFSDLTGGATAAQMLALATGQIYQGNGSNQPAAVSAPSAFVTNSTVSGAQIVSNGTTWVGSTIAAPACAAIAGTVVDWSAGNCFTKTLSANTVFTFSNRVAGQQILLRLTNPQGYTVTFPNTAIAGGSVLWSGSTIPTQTVNKRDLYSIFFDGTDMYGNQTASF